MRIPHLSLALLPLLLAAVPACAQDAGSRPFPGIAWGVDADSVVRVWGEPVAHKPISRGMSELDYVEMDGERVINRYIVVHPSMGTVIAGTVTAFASKVECHDAVRAAVGVIDRAFPRLAWEAGTPPAADAVCDTSSGTNAIGQDAESGTRVSLRLNAAGTHLVVDAISPAGYEWLGGRG